MIESLKSRVFQNLSYVKINKKTAGYDEIFAKHDKEKVDKL
jgi:3-methyladenine DNA glycosylase Tag